MISSMFVINNCACTRLRTAARVVSRAFDDALRPSGINGSQLAVLVAIDVTEATSISELSQRLSTDRTTLSRNLKLLEKSGLVELSDEGWKRSKTVRLTSVGQVTLEHAKTLWDLAQQNFLKRVGKAEWSRVESDLSAITALF